MREIGFTSKVFCPDSIVGQLSGGERQGVAIARAIYNKAELIILDEPTTALSLTETEKVFRFVRNVRASGRSVLFIGHNIHHVFDIAERFIVLDRGRVALEITKAEAQTAERLIAFMEHIAHPMRHDPLSDIAMLIREQRDGAADRKPGDASRPQPVPFIANNRAALGTFAVFLVMMAIFFVGNPSVFSDWRIYSSVLITLPVALFLVVPLVFIVTVGEIDLSFPAVMGFSCWIFALGMQAGYDPFLSFVAGVLVGMALGALIGTIVVYVGLSSLVATLGLSYLAPRRNPDRHGRKIDRAGEYQGDDGLPALRRLDFLASPRRCCGRRSSSIGSIILYNRHQFGARVKCVGDNPDSAAQMGINTKRIRVYTFVFMGFGAALAGIFSTMINFTWWPTAGEAYLLPSLAAVFVGGTPDMGRHRHRRRRRLRRLDRVVHPGRHRLGGPRWVLRATLQRPDHHPGAHRTPMEPDPLSLGPPSFGREERMPTRAAQTRLLACRPRYGCRH